MNTTENNKLTKDQEIHKFMGFVPVPEDTPNYKEWNLLMPVVEKINSIAHDQELYDVGEYELLTDHLIGANIDASYIHVTGFIKWYTFYRDVESFLINKHGWTQEQCEDRADLDCYDQYFGTHTAREAAIDIVASN